MDREKLDLIEKKLDEEFKRRNKKIRIYHIKDVHPFRAVTLAMKVEFKCLFDWNDVSENDTNETLRILKDILNIEWTKNAKVHISVDGKTISISDDENYVEASIDMNKGEVIFNINGGFIHLTVKEEDGNLRVCDTIVPSWVEMSNRIYSNINFQRTHLGYVSASKLIDYLSPHGCAVCDMRDQFNRKKGKVWAMRRLMRILKRHSGI